MNTLFQGLDHIGIAVHDLEAATRTYRDVLGLDVQGGEALPERGLSVRFVNTGGSRIELIAATRSDSEVSKFLATRGEGIHHICIRVQNIKSVLAKMKVAGAQLIDEVPRPGAEGTQVAFVHPKGAHGVLIELVEHPKPGEKSHG